VRPHYTERIPSPPKSPFRNNFFQISWIPEAQDFDGVIQLLRRREFA